MAGQLLRDPAFAAIEATIAPLQTERGRGKLQLVFWYWSCVLVDAVELHKPIALSAWQLKRQV